jgi:hypothetical protein
MSGKSIFTNKYTTLLKKLNTAAQLPHAGCDRLHQPLGTKTNFQPKNIDGKFEGLDLS